MINYIIQVILFQVLFVAVYDFFLSRETFFTKNRWYLLSTALLSFVLPFIKIPTIQKAVPLEYTILLPEIVLSPQTVIEQTNLYQSINYVQLIFWCGFVFFLSFFLLKLTKLIRLIISNEIQKKGSYKLVLLPKQTKAFSFFRFIFLGKDIAENQKEKIIEHELVHSQQNHSADLLFFEFLKIVMWFNPMVWVYQHRISLIHEYISDDVVAKTIPKENYINNLLSDLFQVESISFINQFYKHSLIKKRIIMITKNKSKQIKQAKYLLLLPLLASMLFYAACSDKKEELPPVGKEKSTMYVQTEEGAKAMNVSDKESYFDMMMAFEVPSWEEVQYKDLRIDEKKEFDNYLSKIENTNSKFFDVTKTKIYLNDKGRKTIVNLIDTSRYREEVETEEIPEGASVPFAIIDKAPTFPGCEKGDKECLNKSLMKFVQENFDVDTDGLGLSPGKKRIYVQFEIGKNGEITNVRGRAPHPELEEKAVKMMEKLPTMIPGEYKGEKVGVKYTLPITFVVK